MPAGQQNPVFDAVAKLVDELSALKESDIRGDEMAVEISVHLGSLFKIDSLSACRLATKLYALASNRYLHDVCDRVVILISNHRTIEVRELLKEMSLSDHDAELRKIWSELSNRPK